MVCVKRNYISTKRNFYSKFSLKNKKKKITHVFGQFVQRKRSETLMDVLHVKHTANLCKSNPQEAV